MMLKERRPSSLYGSQDVVHDDVIILQCDWFAECVVTALELKHRMQHIVGAVYHSLTLLSTCSTGRKYVLNNEVCLILNTGNFPLNGSVLHLKSTPQHPEFLKMFSALSKEQLVRGLYRVKYTTGIIAQWVGQEAHKVKPSAVFPRDPPQVE